jgi:hypothetical protein
MSLMMRDSKRMINVTTLNPAKEVTSIKQSPVLKGHIFLVLSEKISYEVNLFKRSHVITILLQHLDNHFKFLFITKY